MTSHRRFRALRISPGPGDVIVGPGSETKAADGGLTAKHVHHITGDIGVHELAWAGGAAARAAEMRRSGGRFAQRPGDGDAGIQSAVEEIFDVQLLTGRRFPE